MGYIFLLLSLIIEVQTYANPLFEDNFEKIEDSIIFKRFSHLMGIVEIIPGVGVNGSAGLRVTYQANNEGSKRLVAKFDLNDAVTEVSLSYDVKFLEDFQFVKGGKLHGVGPSEPITGGQSMKDSGWSSRVMFEEGGAISTYLYDQNKTGIYGETKVGKYFRFQKGRFYSITLYTKLNSSPSQEDGETRIYVDGKLIVAQNHILFWKNNSDASKINKFLFSTFHGGHTAIWAPKDKNGNFVNVHAVFDNFIIEKGMKVRSAPGQ